MFVDSKFTDKRYVTVQDYKDYVFQAPYEFPWSDDKHYLTYEELNDCNGLGTPVGFHAVSGQTLSSGTNGKRLIPAVWHTSINPYINFSGYTIGGGNLSIYNEYLDEAVDFNYISHFSFVFKDGSIFRCDIFSGSLYGYYDEDIDLVDFEYENGYSYANWYSGSTGVQLSQISAHGELSSVTYTGYDVYMDPGEGTLIQSYTVEDYAYIFIVRGAKQKWFDLSSRTPVVFGNSGITVNDIINFNKSGCSGSDFTVYVSPEPNITVTMVPQHFSFPWTWRIIWPDDGHPNFGTVQLQLKNTGGTVVYASRTVSTAPNGNGFISGVTTCRIANSYSGNTFTFNLIGSVTGYTSGVTVTNQTLTTAGTVTQLTFSNIEGDGDPYEFNVNSRCGQQTYNLSQNHLYYSYYVTINNTNVGGDEDMFARTYSPPQYGAEINIEDGVNIGDTVRIWFDNNTQDTYYSTVTVYLGGVNEIDWDWRQVGQFYGNIDYIQFTIPSDLPSQILNRTEPIYMTIDFTFN